MTLPTAIMAAGVVLAMAITSRAQSGDVTFSQNAARSALFEIESGQIIAEWSPSDQVRQFGQRMVADYSDLDEQLKAIASKNNLALPDTPGRENQAVIDMLIEIPQRPRGLYDPAFDQVYIQEMIQQQKADIAAFEKESAQGSDPDLRNWAVRALPVLEEHLRLAYTADKYLGSVSQIVK